MKDGIYNLTLVTSQHSYPIVNILSYHAKRIDRMTVITIPHIYIGQLVLHKSIILNSNHIGMTLHQLLYKVYIDI